MSKHLKSMSLLLVAAFIFASCSKKDNPTNNDLFVGTYKGKISYVKEGENKSTDDGKVTVVKVGSNYNFVFSDAIPDLTGVQFKADGDNAVVSVGDNSAQIIRLTASTLLMAYTKDGAVWTADCTR
ncbi:MAG: hypothetical protein QM768_04800 [Agriterribacter sp.]